MYMTMEFIMSLSRKERCKALQMVIKYKIRIMGE